MSRILSPMLMVFVFTSVFFTHSVHIQGKTMDGMRIVQEEEMPVHVTVILERAYVDGDISQEVVRETIWSMENFWAKYDEWDLVYMGKDKLVFHKNIDDISPLLKTNGYFGITDEGILTIFNGKPRNYNIIQSFFQIDVGRLESTKHEQLKKGIPIKSKNNYVEVLESFKMYSTEEKH
ncbi:BofC C-terminal domain-containing protein [Bacillus massilinigeriensis]|uniref:BofC C-terminal domain-containing protein n=1 Tax=Bacillus massilionigeriensis TaxID=1805475 RepID=UPI00096B2EFC|nr:BofC C-terminal domain-containing protein [Bacillus massilionigeriensis]